MFYELLKQGKRITVEPGKDKINKGFLPSFFTMQDGKVIAENLELGRFEHEMFTNSPETFDAHIAKMLAENFKIIID